MFGFRELTTQLRSLGDRLQRTYCAAARGCPSVNASAEGIPISEMDAAQWREATGSAMPARRTEDRKGPDMAQILERELEGIFSTQVRYEDMPEAEAPSRLTSQLYPHQRKALHWMLQRERPLDVEQALVELSHK